VADPKTWSGTPKRMLDHLGPLFARSGTLNYQLPPAPRFAARVVGRLFHCPNTSRNRYFNALYERQFRRAWQALPWRPDHCLQFSDFCVPDGLDGNARQYVYTDATLMGAAKHLPQGVPESFLAQYRKLSRRYLAGIDTVFTLNEWTRRSFIEDHGVPADRVLNVGFGVNMEPPTTEKNWDRNLLLIVLRPKLELVKGLNLLLEAFPLVRREIPDAELAVVGVELAGAPAGVTFYFNQPRSKTIELMRDATLFAMPAICELNGIVYPEALACRTPILGLDRFAFPEFAGDGRFGFVVKEPRALDVANSIIGALKEKAALKRMGEEGQRFVLERYSWSGTAERIFRAMERL
jgi:glycosyltransferase involved in cell wall biosynthesis